MLSIDITDRQIKLVRGVHSGSKIRVQDADMRELTLGMVSNGYITDVPMVAAELNDIIKTKGITEKDAIVSITSSSIVYKEMLLPKPKSLKNTAAIEAMIQANMGVSKEFNISFTIAGETEDEEKNKLYDEIIHLQKNQNIGINEIENCMQFWDKLTVDDKISVVDCLIVSISASKEAIEITWRI